MRNIIPSFYFLEKDTVLPNDMVGNILYIGIPSTETRYYDKQLCQYHMPKLRFLVRAKPNHNSILSSFAVDPMEAWSSSVSCKPEGKLHMFAKIKKLLSFIDTGILVLGWLIIHRLDMNEKPNKGLPLTFGLLKVL